MISTSVFTALGVLAAIGIILPVGAAIWWIRKNNEKVSTVLVGAATWFLFAIVLETLPKLVLFICTPCLVRFLREYSRKQAGLWPLKQF